ncbi:MAG: FMN-binding protein [Deltaproteobacteria bacterium]|nr:MAG: FMN-binding protein [Deltaproteobacteria bacterium]
MAIEAGPARMMATLGIAGLSSGFALVSIHLLTQPRIERNRAEALEAAIYHVLPGASRSEAFVLRDGELTPFRDPEGRLPDEEAVYAGYDDAGEPVGFAIPAEGPGFQDTIKLIYGYDPARRRIVGMEVLESRETPGLGDKIIKDDAFVENFRDLAVTPELVVVKRKRTRENEVDAISGATISSNAVVRIINEANARWLVRLPGGDATVRAPSPVAAQTARGPD